MPKMKSAMTKRNSKAPLMRAVSFVLIAPVTKLVTKLFSNWRLGAVSVAGERARGTPAGLGSSRRAPRTFRIRAATFIRATAEAPPPCSGIASHTPAGEILKLKKSALTARPAQ